MEQIEFNLLEEPWIRVMKKDCTVEECSLKQVLLKSHEFLRLSGELPTQDVAILRLLLAVLHSVFYRVDANGNEDPIKDEKQALRRWNELWQAKRLPEKPILDYLEQWKDRFWLFHPEHPFYQVPSAERGTEYKAAKLNGELSESSNKIRLFPIRAGKGKECLSYSEAARWLVTLIGFDDSGSVKKEKGTGLGWLGQHVNLYVDGDNLFETLLLNLVFLKDGKELWDANMPTWEKATPKEPKKKEMSIPNNQAELLTLQSRRVLLYREDGKVIAYRTTGGDFFGASGSINAFNEQMTQWQKYNKNVALQFKPMVVNIERQMWRDFETVIGTNAEIHKPGIVLWLEELKRRRILDERIIHIKSVGVVYHLNSNVTDVMEDHLDFHATLLDKAGALWVKKIGEKIEQTERVAQIVGEFAEGLFFAGGGQPNKSNKESNAYKRGMQLYCAEVDIPFRKWISKIGDQDSANQDLRDQLDLEWREEAYGIAIQIGDDMANSAGKSAFTGHWIAWDSKPKNKNKIATQNRMTFVKKKEIRAFYSTSTERNIFIKALKKCLRIDNIRKEVADE